MDLATCITILLTLETYLNGVVTLEECTGQGQSPEVKLGILIKKPEPPALKETLLLNNHLQSNSETKHPIENDRSARCAVPNLKLLVLSLFTLTFH